MSAAVGVARRGGRGASRPQRGGRHHRARVVTKVAYRAPNSRESQGVVPAATHARVGWHAPATHDVVQAGGHHRRGLPLRLPRPHRSGTPNGSTDHNHRHDQGAHAHAPSQRRTRRPPPGGPWQPQAETGVANAKREGAAPATAPPDAARTKPPNAAADQSDGGRHPKSGERAHRRTKKKEKDGAPLPVLRHSSHRCQEPGLPQDRVAIRRLYKTPERRGSGRRTGPPPSQLPTRSVSPMGTSTIWCAHPSAQPRRPSPWSPARPGSAPHTPPPGAAWPSSQQDRPLTRGAGHPRRASSPSGARTKRQANKKARRRHRHRGRRGSYDQNPSGPSTADGSHFDKRTTPPVRHSSARPPVNPPSTPQRPSKTQTGHHWCRSHPLPRA